MSIRKIIAGGQTGVDQAALQAAIDSGVEYGGWCPPDRTCESGLIPAHYNLMETLVDSDQSAPAVPRSQRTIWNVRDAEGLLVFIEGIKLQNENFRQAQDPGSELAIETAEKFGKPLMIVEIHKKVNASKISTWIESNNIQVLNIAGPSEGSCPGIYEKVYKIMIEIF